MQTCMTYFLSYETNYAIRKIFSMKLQWKWIKTFKL